LILSQHRRRLHRICRIEPISCSF